MASSDSSKKKTFAPLWFASLTILANADKEFSTRWGSAAESLDAEDIHDLRVASRRLREAVRLVGPCFDAQKAARLAKEVKKVTTLLGDLRNADEAQAFFASIEAERLAVCTAAVDKLLKRLSRQQARTRRELESALDEAPLKRIRQRIRGLIARLNLFKADEGDLLRDFTTFAGEALRRQSQILDDLLPAALMPQAGKDQHALRIAIKKTRYRLEHMQPFVAVDCRPLHAALKRYQDLLGKLHDLEVFGEMVRQEVAAGPGRDELVQLLDLRREELFAQFLTLVEKEPIPQLVEETAATL